MASKKKVKATVIRTEKLRVMMVNLIINLSWPNANWQKTEL